MANLACVNSMTPGIPDGKTVTPINDAELLQKCAGIANPTYDTIAGIIGDSSILETVITSNNAVDYLVRSTDWTNSVTSNQTAMDDIGNNNYASNTLLADATWCPAICNSTYWSLVLNVQSPDMTGNNTPSGTCTASSTASGYQPYMAFNSTGWFPNTTGPTSATISYEFPSPVKIYKYRYGATDIMSIKLSYLALFADGQTLVQPSIPSSSEISGLISNPHNTPLTRKFTWNFTPLSETHVGSRNIKFYGRVDV